MRGCGRGGRLNWGHWPDSLSRCRAQGEHNDPQTRRSQEPANALQPMTASSEEEEEEGRAQGLTLALLPQHRCKAKDRDL